MENIIGIKQLHQELKQVADRVQEGSTYIVVKNSKPVFRIVPIDRGQHAKYCLKDLDQARFRGSKNLSKDIDKTIYS
jgi:prevent-host-death family protein